MLAREEDYQFPPPPSPARLDRDVWNKAIGDVAARLRSLEGKRTELQDLIDDLSFNGQARLDSAIVPLIDATEAQIVALQAQVAETVAANAGIIENFQEDIAEALANLNAQITAVERRVDTILQGGIPAADVAETADRVFVTPAQKAEIGKLRADVDGKADAQLMASALDQKEDRTAKNQANGYAGLDAAGKLGSLLTTRVTVQTFTSSGTFTKEADDIAYWVEAVAGGGSGGTGSYGGGGCGGECVERLFVASEVPASVSVAIGQGALANTGSNVEGGDGGDTVFGTLLTATGGGKGQRLAGNLALALGCSLRDTTSFIAMARGTTFGMGAITTNQETAKWRDGGGTTKGGGGGAGWNYQSAAAFLGGKSKLHGDGGNSLANGLGQDGIAPGGGGGGGATRGGAGARGQLRVWRFKK